MELLACVLGLLLMHAPHLPVELESEADPEELLMAISGW